MKYLFHCYRFQFDVSTLACIKLTVDTDTNFNKGVKPNKIITEWPWIKNVIVILNAITTRGNFNLVRNWNLLGTLRRWTSILKPFSNEYKQNNVIISSNLCSLSEIMFKKLLQLQCYLETISIKSNLLY